MQARTAGRGTSFGNPYPLLLIGLPDNIVTFHEGKAAPVEVEAADHGGFAGNSMCPLGRH